MTDPRLEIVLAAKDLTGSTFDKVKNSVAGLSKSVLSLQGVMVGLAGATGIGLLVMSCIDAVSEIDRLSTMAGVSAEAFQELDFAAGQYQITQDSLTDGLKELSLRGDEFAVTGGGSAKEAFERLGFTADELNQRLDDTPELLSEVIRRMEGLDTASKIRISDELFGGTGGEQFVKMIQGGSKAFDDMRKSAHDLGMVLDNDLVQQSVDAKKDVDKLTRVLSAQFLSVVSELAPEITKVSTNTLNWISANKDLIGQGVDTFVHGVGDSFDYVTRAITKTTDAVSSLIDTYNKFPDSLLTRFLKSQIDAQREDLKSTNEFLRSAGFIDDVVTKPITGSYTPGGKQSESKPGRSSATTGKQTSASKQATTLVEQTRLLDAAIEGAFNEVDLYISEYSDLMAEGAEVTKAMRTPTEELADETERLTKLLGAGAINANTFGLAMAKAQEDIKGAAIDADLSAFFSELDAESEQLAGSTTDAWSEAFSGFANSYSSTLNDMLWGSETTFESVAVSFAKMITEMVIQQELVAPFVNGMSGDGGWLSTGFSAVSGLFAASANGNVFSGNPSGISAYSNSVVSSPTVFPFATGVGLMGEAGAEAILPLTRLSGGDLGVRSSGENTAPNVQINIENKTGQEVTSSGSEPKWNGRKWVVSMVLEAMQKNSYGINSAMKAVSRG